MKWKDVKREKYNCTPKLVSTDVCTVFFNENTFLLNRWSPDAIVFNSWQHYGCPNYWMLHFFKDSSGAALHPSTIQVSNYNQLVASSITWQNSKDGNTYLKIKVLLFSGS
jgi:alpha-N-arabinofuranosidase